MIRWAVAQKPMYPGDPSGDFHLVAPFPGGVLVAVLDGRGHGPDAEKAARAAAAILAESPGDPLPDLFRRCHDRTVRKTRGAAISAAAIEDSGRMTWAAVGDVTGVLARLRGGRERLAVQGGFVGMEIPAEIRTSALMLEAGDVLAFASDGVEEKIAESVDSAGEVDPQQAADRLLAKHRTKMDDSIVWIGRWNA